MSRALGGLYGGRVSCHVSIMYGTHSQPCAQPEYRGRASVAWLVRRLITRLFGGSVCPSQVVIWRYNWRGGGPEGGEAQPQQQKQEQEQEEEEENCNGQPSQFCASLCPGWQRPAQSQKTGPTRRGEQDGDGPGCAPVNSSVLQGQARCEMADGRWQQGTLGSVSTGWAGWWTGGGARWSLEGGKEQ